jgi:VWFA-related protein
MRRLLPVLACTILATFVVGGRTVAQGPTFRSAVDLVDVDVSVLDRNRLPVRGLTAEDFTVFEDGKPRAIAAFSAVDLPARELASAPWMTHVAPDVLTNTFKREGRLVTILIDRALSFENMPAVREFAEAAVDQLRPGDLAAVAYSLSGVPQNFTADRARLKQAIRQPSAGLPEGSAQSQAACACGVCTLESITRIAEAMQEVRQRRKLLFVLSNRIAIQSNGPCGGALIGARGRALRALEAANATVHVFDPTGLQTQAFSAAMASLPTNRMFLDDMRRRGNLQVLPEHTGGRFVTDSFRPAPLVAELFRESDSYYVLGFQPQRTDAKPRFHDIRVKVNRRDVTWQARRGYYSNGSKAKDITALPKTIPVELRSRINGLWPETGVAMTMNLVPLSKPALDGAVVAVTLDVTQEFEERVPPPSPRSAVVSAIEPTHVNVLVGAFDRDGKALAFDRQALVVTPRRLDDRRFEYQALMNLDLKPGRYEIRAAVEDQTLGKSGSVYGYVDVPDFRKQAVTLSGVALGVQPGVPSTPLGALAPILPIVPSTRRQFTQSDVVTGFVRLYQGLSRPATPGYFVAEVRNEQDQVVYRQETRITTQSMGAGRATDINVHVPVDRLPLGSYLLAVEARHGSETATREVRFDIGREARP